MKAGELRELSAQELIQREKELAMELFNLRFQMATGQLSNHAAIRKTKKDIARIKTVLNEKDNRKDNAGS
ncbi:MAG: 50S ribosomal protein L29 [Deltaproteobacteria bacterium]|nr:50S ribosomal protein L29 [Deltaproteobacteria bacterium]OQY16344.1 MAG: 50S ribosomal protein L29 [Desulfobacterium sp. 4572_20]RLJ04235.1 MAG: 50S ribosomal protein L29 [Candidatus Aenigmarchaeota archaeon]HDH88055.1 50S ribosomal protein L29 [Desulfobacteraceae bacterium]MBW2105086.1 50S ribosomal protein L29 [Deltaproteobacteria bacterium]